MSLRGSALLDTFKESFADTRRLMQRSLVLAAGHDDAFLSRRGHTAWEARASSIAPQFSLQQSIRPLFGKGDIRPARIGTHPDFAHLAGPDDALTCPIVTLFMDIENSTRLELWYEPAQVAEIKNAFLCTAIELVQAFDGHVHRLQGDAVMAFFGGTAARPENAVIDAINCASALWLFVKSTVTPALQAEGYDEDFGIRIGVDYAPDAHWCAFGYPGVNEVTATGFGVSAAAKLQHSAGRNQIMLGQRLVEFLDIPDVITSVKQIQRNGDDVSEPFLLPNITTPSGNPHNYRKLLFRADEYLPCGPLSDALQQLNGDRRGVPLRCEMHVHVEQASHAISQYSATSCVLPKKHLIKFSVSLPFQPQLPYTVRYDVENHGQEALTCGRPNCDNHCTEDTIETSAQHRNLTRWEHTQYRGLHYMTITVSNASGLVACRRIGIFIE